MHPCLISKGWEFQAWSGWLGPVFYDQQVQLLAAMHYLNSSSLTHRLLFDCLYHRKILKSSTYRGLSPF